MERKYEFEFKYKKEGSKGQDLYVAGYANRAAIGGERVIDRGKESIPAEEWKIEEWMKNPIIFFNHDRDFPIGKGVSAKVSEDGLWIKVKISNSKNPEIQRVRDLIEEEILKTFSVGIDVQSEEEIDGVLILKGVNLLETSIVSIPMNQESFFEVSKKMLKEKSTRELAVDFLRAKGASLASAIHAKIHELQGAGEDFDRAAKLTEIATRAEISLDELNDILAGNTVSVSEEVLGSISELLGMDLEELQGFLKEDIARTDPDSLNRPNEDEAEDGDGEQEGEDDKSKTDVQGEDFQKCVSDHINRGVSDGKDRDQAIAWALSECRKKHGGACELKQDDWDKILKDIDNSKEFADADPEHETDEGTISTTDTDATNALLQEMRKTNQLLTQLIAETQRASAFATIAGTNPTSGQVQMALDKQKKEGDKKPKKEENVDITENYLKSLDKKLKNLEAKI